MGQYVDSKGRRLGDLINSSWIVDDLSDVQANNGVTLSELAELAATTQSELYATNTAIRTYVDAEIAALVDSAPEALDTLNELAAALGDDENFATTLTTNLAQKLGATASVSITGDMVGSGSFSANAVTISVVDQNLANTNAYIASVETDLATLESTVTTNAATAASDLANTNAYIASVESDVAQNTSDIATNAAEIATNAADIATNAADIATNAADIAAVEGDLATQTAKQASDLANTNAYIASTVGDLDTLRTELYSTNTAIRSYVDAEVAALVDSAPEALDTLNELAAALGDDANFATTLTTNLSQKLGATASVTLTGEVTGTANFSANAVSIETVVAPSGVVANTYGSSSLIPVVTVGADGRITEVTTTQVAGVTGAEYTASNNTITISTADGSEFTATITDLKEISEAQAELANTNARVAVVEANVAQKLGATASVTLTGDATASGSFSSNAVSLAVTLADSGVSAGSYGSATEVPVVTVDAKGRVTSVSTQTVAGVNGFSYETSNNTFSISTADGSVFNATITDLEEVSDALGKLANTNAYIADTNLRIDDLDAGLTAANNRLDTVISELDTQEAKQASDLANTNARVAVVEGNVSTLDAKVDSNLANTNARIAVTEADIAQAFTDIQATNTAIRAYVDAEVSALVDSAPEALDTLNELAAALGDDANFASTLTTNLSQKLGSTASVALTGDATASGSFSANAISLAVTLANSGVTAGEYGSSSQIPVVTVDSKGRVTDVSEVAVAGVTSFSYTDANNTLVIATADGGSFEAQIENFELASDADARLANTNAYIASVASDLDTQEAKQASDLANTNAYIASTVGDLDTLRSELYSTNTAIRSYVDAEVAALVDSAPEALDTLNELAAALGDDENFATTISTNLGQKLGATATVTLSGDVTGSASFSANAVTITTVDQNLANTNAYIASVASDLATQVAAERSALANTNAQIITLDTKVDSNLANTNAKLINIEDNLLATNTAIRALIPDEIGFSEYVFTATDGQTVFTGTDDNGKTFSYTTDKLSVFLNGVMLVKGVDYVQTNSTTITLDDAAIADDVVTIQAHEVANYVSKEGEVAPVVAEGVNAANTVLDSFGTGDFRTVKYLVQATDGTNNEYESMEVMVLHNGTTVQLVEYASLQTGGSLVTLDADIFGGNVRLLGTPTDASVTVKAVRLAVSA